MKKVQIKNTSKEPSEFHNVKGYIIRTTVHGYVIIKCDDGREIILHPKSVKEA